MTEKKIPLLIKRYASRRLYNTETSDYVTLDDIAAVIRSGRDVEIVDLKTGDDLTRQYLLQIITEHEAKGDNMLPINVLTDLVRGYADEAQSFVPEFLAQSFEMMKRQQAELMENVQKAIPDPMAAFGGLEGWQQKQRDFMSAMLGTWGQKPPEATPSGEAEDIAEIKKQLAELQDKLAKL